MWEQVKMPNRHFLRSDIFTVAMVYYFYFLCFSSTRNVFNNLWEKEGRTNTATTEQMDRALFLFSSVLNLLIKSVTFDRAICDSLILCFIFKVFLLCRMPDKNRLWKQIRHPSGWQRIRMSEYRAD